MTTQHEITTASPLLTPRGRLSQAGWARQPLLDCNLEAVRFYPAVLRPLQRFRVKRWDYYGVTTPQRFFSFTLADLGYAGQAFVYTVDFASGHYHEETVTIPLSRGIQLPRNSTEGDSHYDNGKLRLSFRVMPTGRRLQVQWPDFAGQPLSADIVLHLAPEHESTVVVIPIAGNRFYYNRKVNCLPAEGWLDLLFTPFVERVARTNLLVITSEVHQMFGRYAGRLRTDDGETIQLDGLVGFAEEHHARW